MKNLNSITLSLIFVLILNSFNTFSQKNRNHLYSPVPKTKTAKSFLNRPIVILKPEMNDKTKKKLKIKNPDIYNFQMNYNKYFEENVLEYFKKYFIGSKDISLKSYDELIDMINEGREFVIVSSRDLKKRFSPVYKPNSKEIFSFKFYLSENIKPDLIIYSLNLYPAETDFLFLVQQVNSILKDVSEEKKIPIIDDYYREIAKELKNKTLIISPNDLKKGYTIEEVKETYKFPIKYTDDNEEIRNIILSKKPGYAYVTTTFSRGLMGHTYLFVDSETGKILCAMGAAGITFRIAAKPPNGQSGSDFSLTLMEIKPKLGLWNTHFRYLQKFNTKD